MTFVSHDLDSKKGIFIEQLAIYTESKNLIIRIY